MTIFTHALTIPDKQKHVVANWDSLTEPQQEDLAEQIHSIDFELIQRLYETQDDSVDWGELANRASPPDAIRLAGANRFSLEAATEKGLNALSRGEIGVVLVAGGQGSRLGFEHPKGMYPIGPLSQRTLFQFHVDQLLALGKKIGKSIPLYLMTSPATHDETVEYFRLNNRCGLAEEDLQIFCQGTLPAVDKSSGKVLLAGPGQIFRSPDGHGGMLEALGKYGCLDEIEAREIRQLFYLQVDNPIVEMCAPALIGYHLLAESELTTQVVAKENPLDKVGNVVMVDGTMSIIEYSDLPAESARRIDKKGNPVFWAGNIAVHVFDVDFLRKCAESPDALPYHRALKRVPYMDDRGYMVFSSEKNAIKFEKFIFDLMPLAKNPIVVEAEASEVFAPLKNAIGEIKDTPQTTQKAILAKCRRMLDVAGIEVATGVDVEINPLFAFDSSELAEKLDGNQITTDCYLI